MRAVTKRVHFLDPALGEVACGLNVHPAWRSGTLEDVTCKVCLKVATQGHR